MYLLLNKILLFSTYAVMKTRKIHRRSIIRVLGSYSTYDIIGFPPYIACIREVSENKKVRSNQ